MEFTHSAAAEVVRDLADETEGSSPKAGTLSNLETPLTSRCNSCDRQLRYQRPGPQKLRVCSLRADQEIVRSFRLLEHLGRFFRIRLVVRPVRVPSHSGFSVRALQLVSTRRCGFRKSQRNEMGAA